MRDAARPIYGLLAEFEQPEAAARPRRGRRARRAIAEWMRYSPFPGRGTGRGAGLPQDARCRCSCLIGGIVGGTGGFFLQYCVAMIAYPINVGGRPLNSWPAFIPITFEMTIL